MTTSIQPSVQLKLAGVRGENILDAVRRLGLGGAGDDATDPEAALFLALYSANQAAGAPVYNSSASFKIIGADVTRYYAVGKHVRVSGTLTGTIYGTINTSAYATGNTTVTVTWESGSLSNEVITVAIIPGPSGAPVNVTDAAYGAVGSGAVDDGPAIQLAATAAAGNILFFPPGTYKISTAVTLSAGTIVQGCGDTTIIDANVNDYFKGTSAHGVELRDLKIQQHTGSNSHMTFTTSNRLKFMDINFDGTRSDAAKCTAQAIWLKGCADPVFFGSRFEDCNNAIYLDASGGTNCSRVKVLCCHFEHLDHGNSFANPAQVYQFNCKELLVTGCTFKNIFPGTTGISYCIYEGDGSATTLQVRDNYYVTTEARTDTCFCYSSSSSDVLVGGNVAVAEDAAGGGYLYRGTAVAKALHLSDNIGRAFGILAAEDGDSETIQIVNNDIINNTALFAAIQVGVSGNAATAVHVDVRGNRVRNSTYGGIFINAGTWFDVADNDLLDCNTSNTARSGGNEKKSSCIVVTGESGRVTGNRMKNSASGHAKYGIDLTDSVNTTYISQDNSFTGMETGDVNNHVYLNGSGTYDPASLNDGAGATTTITVSGAALGDKVADWSFSLDLQGVMLIPYVSGTDTVAFRFQNESGGTVDLGSGILRARVEKKR